MQEIYGQDLDAATGTADGEIDAIYLKVSLAAGATGQDLNQTVIEVQNNTQEVNLQGPDGTDGSATSPVNTNTHYDWEVIKEQDGSEDQYVESGDLYNITVNLDNAIDGSVGTQEPLNIRIIPKHGTPTYEEVVTPPVITERMVDL